MNQKSPIYKVFIHGRWYILNFARNSQPYFIQISEDLDAPQLQGDINLSEENINFISNYGNKINRN